ncbi:LuxR C-terminal-related transcriptional regulator [Patulibacter sp. NPDC049589]|uniref:response regulator transcription factor n=1 Tax=Patulibacter sp. NPDC049589 TaxID=3154731 RepID=UPI003447CBE3
MPVLTSNEGRADPLTPRELDVVRGVIAGLGNRDIGVELHLSERTVQSHVANAMRKMGTSTRTGLAVSALRRGLVPLDDPDWRS